MPAKIWLAFLDTACPATVNRTLFFGIKERPVIGWRKWLVDVNFKAMNYLILALGFIKIQVIEDDYDYSEWLGPDYKEKQELPIKVSTHIGAPH